MRPRPLLSTAAPNAPPTLALALLVLSLAAGCDRPPSADSLKEWTQADHHSTDDDKLASGAAPQVTARAATGAPAGGDVAQLVDITWRQQCTTCHGPMGRGDGQMGPMVQAPDLTRADWQSKVTDVEMAGVIKAGRNRMPSFNLPDPVLGGLVARIRSLGRPEPR
jgi:mono/diheme cytochrome c family protein